MPHTIAVEAAVLFGRWSSASRAAGAKTQVQIGGPPQGQALIGLRDHAWAQIGETPLHHLAHLGYAGVGAVWHAGPPSPAALPGMFPAHPEMPVNPRDFVVHGSSAGELVVVARRAAFHEPFAVIAASAGGETLQPLHRDQVTAVHRAPRDRGEAVEWTLDVHATPDYVDVLTLPPAKPDAP